MGLLGCLDCSSFQVCGELGQSLKTPGVDKPWSVSLFGQRIC